MHHNLAVNYVTVKSVLYYWSRLGRVFATWLLMLYSQKQNYAQTYKRDRRHAKDLGAGTQEYRQQHSLPWRPEYIAVDQLPSELLLSVLPGIDLR